MPGQHSTAGASENWELKPKIVVQVFLDGDDDAAAQTDNALDALRRAVAAMKADGLIQDGTVALLPEPE